MAKQTVPGAYKGGVKKWEQDRSNAMAMHARTLAMLQGPEVANSPMRIGGIFENQLALGLFHAWDGNGTEARGLLAAAAATAESYVERGLPGLTSTRAPDLALIARNGAAAAELTGDDRRSRLLFEYAQRFAAALVTTEDERPADPGAGLDPMAVYPLTRAYSLIRLGRLAGFHAMVYPEGAAETLPGKPVWALTDIDALLATAEICLRLGKDERPADYPAEQGLLPLLRALRAAQAAPEAAEARTAAQEALAAYFRLIRNLADFRIIYLLVLDLQRAFVHIFSPVAPDPLGAPLDS